MKRILLALLIILCLAMAVYTSTLFLEDKTPKQDTMPVSLIDEESSSSVQLIDYDSNEKTQSSKETYEPYYINGYMFDFSAVSQTEFDSLKGIYYRAIIDTIPYITDEDRIREEIGEYITEHIENGESSGIIEIKDRKGNIIYSVEGEHGDALWFDTYYPEQDILLLEGGHSTEMPYNLTTGDIGLDAAAPLIGFPLSPSKRFEIRRWYGGQDDTYLILNEKNNGKAKRINTLLPNDHWSDIHFAEPSFWVGDSVLYLESYTKEPYKITITPHKREITSNNLISSESVCPFRLTDKLSDLQSKYTLTPSHHYSGYGKDEHIVRERFSLGIKNMIFEARSISGQNTFTDILENITVANAYYATDKGISVGSTISDLKKSYPDLQLYWEKGMQMVGISPSIKNIRFVIESNGVLFWHRISDQKEKMILLENDNIYTKAQILSIEINNK